MKLFKRGGCQPLEFLGVGNFMKLEPNSVYVIESKRILCREELDLLAEQLAPFEKDGIKFLVLDAGYKIARKNNDAI